MSVKNVISSQENLWTWFEKLNCPTWNLYRGFHNKLLHSQLIYRQTDTNKTVEESFDELVELTNMQSGSGAQFTIYVPYMSGNKGASIFYGLGAYASGRGSAINGLPQTGMGVVSINDVDRRIQEARNLWELEKTVEDLQAAERGRMSFWETMMEKVVEEVDLNKVFDQIGAIATAALSKRPVSLQGTPGEAINQPEAPAYEYAEEVILPFLDSIRQHFDTNEEFANFLQNVQTKFQQNPRVFISMINQ